MRNFTEVSKCWMKKKMCAQRNEDHKNRKEVVALDGVWNKY